MGVRDVVSPLPALRYLLDEVRFLWPQGIGSTRCFFICPFLERRGEGGLGSNVS